MERYLVKERFDVADEGYVGLIKVLSKEELDKIKSIHTGFGNIEGDSYEFNKKYAKKITDEEFKVLKKFGLIDLEFGYCSLSWDEIDEDEDWEDENE